MALKIKNKTLITFIFLNRCYFKRNLFISNLFGKKSTKTKWFDVEYPCSDQVLNNTLINKMVNRLWVEKFKAVDNSTQYLTIMFRVRLADTREIKTITKLQKLKFENKEYLKSFIDLKAFMLQELYSNAPIKSVIFSYGVKEFSKLRNDFKDTVYEEMGQVKTETLFHHYKNYKLPLSTDLNKYGKILLDLPNGKNIKLDNKTNLNIRIETRDDGFTYHLIDYVKNNNIRISWIDKIISSESDHLIRTIGQTIIDYQNNSFNSITTLKKFKNITNIKPQKQINTKFIGADLETYLDKDNNMVPYLASFYQQDKNGYVFNNNVNILFETFFRKLLNRKNRGYDIYFHNLSGFDGFFLMRYLIKFGYEVNPLMHGGKLIQINIKSKWDTWTLKDSYLILLQALSKLSTAFKLDSSMHKDIFPYYLNDINYNGDFPEYKYFNQDKTSLTEYNLIKENFKNLNWNFKSESINYCLKDSKILFMILKNFSKLIFDKFSLNISKYPTAPSLAFAIYRSKHLSKDLSIAILIGKTKEDIKLSYTGGSTDMFIPSLNVLTKTDKKIYAYDVNSLYPFVMANNDYPVGDPIFIEYPNLLVLKKDSNIFGFYFVNIKAPDNLLHPILQLHHKTTNGIRTISPIGSFSGWFFSEELKNALNFGYEIEIIKGYNFERANIFKEYVDELYSIRTSYSKTHPLNYIAKILLNSLYGRFGMTDIFSNILLIDKKEFQDWTDNEKLDIEDIIDFDNKMLIKFKPESSLKQDIYGSDPLTANVNIAIASAVTAYARIHMSQFKNNLNLPKLYYTDTDSAYFDGPLPNFMVDSTRLGALKLEGIWDKAIFLAPKVYALNNKSGESVIKVKGLTKEAIKRNNVTFDSLTFLLNEDYKLILNQTKWFKSIEKANIKVLDQVYTLQATSNKRNLIYKEGKLINTTHILL